MDPTAPVSGRTDPVEANLRSLMGRKLIDCDRSWIESRVNDVGCSAISLLFEGDVLLEIEMVVGGHGLPVLKTRVTCPPDQVR